MTYSRKCRNFALTLIFLSLVQQVVVSIPVQHEREYMIALVRKKIFENFLCGHNQGYAKFS